MILHSSLQSILTWLELPREIANCYQLLGLSFDASFAEIQASYRQLVQQYDFSTDIIDQQAKEKFWALTEAYQHLATVMQSAQNDKLEHWESDVSQNLEVQGQQQASVERSVGDGFGEERTQAQSQPPLSEYEQQLKWLSYYKLQQFLKYQQFPKAIALVEGLAQRLPHEPQVNQWQADAYQRWGRQLLKEKQLKKARIYLKKALKTDPHNPQLWFEVEQDFRSLEQTETTSCGK